MNFSDYDSEDYSSDDDADYVPSDDNLSEDDMNECVNEDGLDPQSDELPSKVVKKKKSKKAIGVRKRKKGMLELEDKSSEEVNEGDQGTQGEEKGKEAGEGLPAETREVWEKQKADDLWASFLSDVGHRPKPTSPDLEPSAADSKATLEEQSEASEATSKRQEDEEKQREPSKITITKVFDFAGEEVRVTKEVDANSKEAKSFLKTEEMKKEPNKPSVTSPGPGPSVKRPAGLGGILNRIGGKKQKMSTLEKSRLDWDAFKEEEGIQEELAVHNRGKDGYLERKNFLERVDHRQFELERSVRLSNMKR